MSVKSKIESILFVSIRPMSIKDLMERAGIKKKEEVNQASDELMAQYNVEGSGVNLQKIDDKVQMVTAKENSEIISEFLKDETTGELTPASLETLTVIAYRGPITRTELELIRGVNCSLILRNLLIRGLIEEKKGADELLSTYQITFDFLKFLGLSQASQLPEYLTLNSDENLQKLLNPDKVQDESVQNVPDSSDLK